LQISKTIEKASVMAPRPPSMDSKEYENFIQELKIYYEKRGTPFDPKPRVSQKEINLLELFNEVNRKGGYDKVRSSANFCH
jgi:hypothetical protein